MRQVPRETAKRSTLVAASPDFARRRAEVQACGIARISGHRLPLDRPPRLRFWQTLIEPFPRASAVARTINGRPTARRCARPYRRAVHRKDPQRVGIARMRDHRKADIAHALRHRRADLLPLLVRSIDPEDAAVILLIQAIGMT